MTRLTEARRITTKTSFTFLFTTPLPFPLTRHIHSSSLCTTHKHLHFPFHDTTRRHFSVQDTCTALSSSLHAFSFHLHNAPASISKYSTHTHLQLHLQQHKPPLLFTQIKNICTPHYKTNNSAPIYTIHLQSHL